MAVYAILVLGLFVTEMILHYKEVMPLFDSPPVVLVILSVPILLRICVADYTNQRFQFTLAMCRDNAPVIMAFVLIIAVNFFSVLQPDTNLQYENGKAIYILIYRFAMFCMAMLTAMLFVSISWRGCCIIALLVLVGSIAYDLHYPGTFSQAQGRAAGYPGNPNQSAITVVMLCALIVRYDRFRLVDVCIAALGFLTVFATLSRGGALLYAVFLVYYFFQVLYRAKAHRRMAEVVPALFLTASLLVVAAFVASTLVSSSSMFSSENAQRRLATFTFQDDAVYESDDVRLSLVPAYLDRIDRHVILGYGPGYSRSLAFGPHNTYLQIWVNIGLFGVLAYVALLFAAYRIFSLRSFDAGKGFIMISVLAGFVNHSILHLPVFLILLGLSLGASWCEWTSAGRLYMATASRLRPSAASVGGVALIPSYRRLLPRLPVPLPGRRRRSSP